MSNYYLFLLFRNEKPIYVGVANKLSIQLDTLKQTIIYDKSKGLNVYNNLNEALIAQKAIVSYHLQVNRELIKYNEIVI